MEKNERGPDKSSGQQSSENIASTTLQILTLVAMSRENMLYLRVGSMRAVQKRCDTGRRGGPGHLPDTGRGRARHPGPGSDSGAGAGSVHPRPPPRLDTRPPGRASASWLRRELLVNKRRIPRSTPAPDTFPPAGPGEGCGRGHGAGVGQRGRPGPARAGAESRHSRRGSPRPSAPRHAAGMRRAEPWCLLLAAACALGRPPPPRAAVRCRAAGACFSAHLDNASYAEARSACIRRRGDLAWVSGEPELRLLLGLLAQAAAGPAPSLFWVGLKRNASACTHAAQPLRGFSWEGAGGGAAPREVPAALGRWAKEPVRSCLTARCAGLHLAAAAGGPSWGWKERACQRDSQGFVCKYREEGACPDLGPAGALHLDYRLPFEERSAGPGFSPPGTVLTVACPGGEVRLRCQPERGGFAWKGAEEPLCPCPSGYRSPGGGRCAESAGCRDADGGFACACVHGRRDGAACAATEAAPTAAGGPAEATGGRVRPPVASAGPPAAAGGEKRATPPPSSSSSNYVFILVAVAVVVLVILVMTVLGVFKLCFNRKPEGRGEKGPSDAPSKAETGSAELSGAAGGD
ncbi:LOW QUALITY PROTEIN: C-type lectin domain family 14 member A [Opisthocomus hoazin]|uniref:LOW QUALITY PROTEIN: C-type lectin domain family 14 member A n=1 Tax=Opisthocomus hoazin TaxID=30419 RepID=UPI003F531BB3